MAQIKLNSKILCVYFSEALCVIWQNSAQFSTFPYHRYNIVFS